MLIAPYEAVNEHSTMPRNESPVNFKDRTHFRLVITTSTNSFQNGWCKSKRLGPGALFRAHWTPGPAFTYTCSPTVCIRKRSKLLFTNQRERFMGMEDGERQLEETICSSSKKPTSKWLFTRGESAFNRVSVLLSTKTKIFLDKIKKENNGKRRGRKKADSVPNRNLSFPVRHLGLPQDQKAPMRITELFDSTEN